MKSSLNPNLRAYVSHTIRGKKGNKATPEDMINNCKAASDFAEVMRGYILDWHRMEGLPMLDLYVPGDHDEFVQIAYHKGYLTETQILEIDCEIISKCDLLIVLGNYLSSGMKKETKYAEERGIPILTFLGNSDKLERGEQIALLAAIDFISEEED